jgi:hypothetical protein
VSPWVEPGSVYNEEYRHTSLIATLRKTWGLGEAFTQRDASARTFDHVFSRATPRDPETWAAITARPVPDWTMDPEVVGKGLSTLGMGIGPALIARVSRWECSSRPNSPTREQSFHHGSSSASSGRSPVTSSHSLPETPKPPRVATQCRVVKGPAGHPRHGRLYHIGVGRTHARTHVIVLVHDLHIRIVDAATGELLRHEPMALAKRSRNEQTHEEWTDLTRLISDRPKRDKDG